MYHEDRRGVHSAVRGTHSSEASRRLLLQTRLPVRCSGPAGSEAFGGEQQPRGIILGNNPLVDKFAQVRLLPPEWQQAVSSRLQAPHHSGAVCLLRGLLGGHAVMPAAQHLNRDEDAEAAAAAGWSSDDPEMEAVTKPTR